MFSVYKEIGGYLQSATASGVGSVRAPHGMHAMFTPSFATPNASMATYRPPSPTTPGAVDVKKSVQRMRSDDSTAVPSDSSSFSMSPELQVKTRD